MSEPGDLGVSDVDDLEERLEWVCGDCALIWPHPSVGHDCCCDRCEGALVDPLLVVTATV